MKTTLTKLLLTSASALFLLSQQAGSVVFSGEDDSKHSTQRSPRTTTPDRGPANPVTAGVPSPNTPNTEVKIVYRTAEEVPPLVAAARRVRGAFERLNK